MGGVTLTRALWTGIGGDPALIDRVAQPFAPTGALPSSFRVEEFGAAALTCVGLAIAELTGAERVVVDGERVADAIRSEQTLRIGDEEPASVWDPLSSIFPTADGAVRLHGNYAQHRAAIHARFGTEDPDEVGRTIQSLPGDTVESNVHAAGGVAAAARSLEEWAQHPAGIAAAAQPLVSTTVRDDQTAARDLGAAPHTVGPLAGLRVLELTRVIAGPIAGRTLAWFGAEVVRVESPRHHELRTVIVDTGPGKRSTMLDLQTPAGREAFERLLGGADVFLHGLRPGAVDELGLPLERRAELAPGLIDASLSAYGPGPWHTRRGFDSLVQLSTGLGLAEARAADPGAVLPRALPCQVLDHTTGLLLAAAIIRAANARRRGGHGRTISASLARTAAELAAAGRVEFDGTAPQPARIGSLLLSGAFGGTSHTPFPVAVSGAAGGWRDGPPAVGADQPAWH